MNASLGVPVQPVELVADPVDRHALQAVGVVRHDRLLPVRVDARPGACSLVRVQLTFSSLWEFGSLQARL